MVLSRDEFRFLWKKMSGDVSLAADVSFPNPTLDNDRKALLVIRQSLDDDSKEAMVAEHGTGMIHLAQHPGEGRYDHRHAVPLWGPTGQGYGEENRNRKAR